MTYERALDLLTRALVETERSGTGGQVDFVKTVIGAVEKQIPKKVVRMHAKYDRAYNDKFFCPSCGETAETECGDTFADYGLNWCDHCGQALDWKE